jgi:hypothetical protein
MSENGLANTSTGRKDMDRRGFGQLAEGGNVSMAGAVVGGVAWLLGALESSCIISSFAMQSLEL